MNNGDEFSDEEDLDLDFDPSDEGDEVIEVEVHIEPRFETLHELGLSFEDLEAALPTAIDEYHDRLDLLGDDDAVPDLADAPVVIHGRSHRLGDLADIVIGDDQDDDEE